MRTDGGYVGVRADRYPRPEGDPGVLRSVAADQRTASGRAREASDQVEARAGTIGAVWTGEASAKALVSLNGYALLVDEVVTATTAAAGALDVYADALATMQATADRLNAEHATLLRRYDAAIARTYPDAAAAMDASADAQRAYWTGTDGLDDEYGTAGRAFDDAALACLRALESTLPSFVRGHNESLDDWVEGMMTDWATRVPVLRDHMGLVRGAVWASTTSLPVAATAVLGKGFSLARYGLDASRYPLRGVSLLGGLKDAVLGVSPAYKAFLNGEAGRVSQLLMGTDRSANLLRLSVPEGATFAQKASAVGSTAGLLRGAGIVGGVVSTGVSAANVVMQGNPVDAFREKGAAYVADVAEVGFNASMTAAMIAPNPVTVGAVVVTGVVYAGAEIVANWDDIAEFGGDVLDGARQGYEAASRVVGDAADKAVDFAKDAASFLNPFD